MYIEIADAVSLSMSWPGLFFVKDMLAAVPETSFIPSFNPKELVCDTIVAFQ